MKRYGMVETGMGRSRLQETEDGEFVKLADVKRRIDMAYKHYTMQFFQYDHLPPHLQAVSKPFGDLAAELNKTLPENPEKSTALRKLLEAKDCAVRAVLFKLDLSEIDI
jgi:ferritin-like protein